jgi:hypothetical protein
MATPRWKVFLSKQFEDDHWYTIYFAQFSIARFDRRQLRVLPLKKAKSTMRLMQGKELLLPLPPHPSPQTGGTESVRDVPGLKCQGSSRLFR